MTPTEELIKAAGRIREVAAKATPGPWLNLDNGDRIIRDPDATAREDDSDPCGEGPPLEYVVDEPLSYPENGDHIVLFDPIVAEAVAKLLANAADALKTASGRAPSLEQSEAAENWYRHELAVARAVNSKAVSR